jgi:hypothetical protein
MDFSERNKKVALARWNKILSEERKHILDTAEASVLKAALCGFLAGDGSIQVRKEKTFLRYDIGFFPDDDIMLTTYCDMLKKLYGKIPSIKRKNEMYSVRLSSRIVVEDLLNQASFGLKNWDLPHSLFSNNGAKEAWLRAFFSADGYVGANTIRVQTVNKNGMINVSKLLRQLGIDHKMYRYVPCQQAHSIVYIVAILKKSARQLFLDKIGFWHSKKTAALKKALVL